jgi:hypothetical protein
MQEILQEAQNQDRNNRGKINPHGAAHPQREAAKRSKQRIGYPVNELDKRIPISVWEKRTKCPDNNCPDQQQQYLIP